MKLFASLCLLFVVIGCTMAYPKSRPGYYPRSYMVGGSFYASPRYIREGPGYEYLPPPGQMTAMVMGDTVATNSFSGSPYVPPRAVLSIPTQSEEEELSEQVTERQQDFVAAAPEPDSINETEPEVEKGGEQETLFSLEEATTEAAAVPTTKAVLVTTVRVPTPTRKVKAGKARRPVQPKPVAEEEEEDTDDEPGLAAAWPFGGARGGVPAYNAFFPIFISGSGKARSRAAGQDEGIPGSATAIANSFSTGKGGVATSHATAFGDPYAAAMLRNAGLFNFRTKSGRKQPVQEELEE